MVIRHDSSKLTCFRGLVRCGDVALLVNHSLAMVLTAWMGVLLSDALSRHATPQRARTRSHVACCVEPEFGEESIVFVLREPHELPTNAGGWVSRLVRRLYYTSKRSRRFKDQNFNRCETLTSKQPFFHGKLFYSRHLGTGASTPPPSIVEIGDQGAHHLIAPNPSQRR